jgi:hypothetical protein
MIGPHAILARLGRRYELKERDWRSEGQCESKARALRILRRLLE